MRFGRAEKRAQVARGRAAQEAIDGATNGFGSRNFFPATKQRQFPNLFLRQIHNGSHDDIIPRHHLWSRKPQISNVPALEGAIREIRGVFGRFTGPAVV
jgi:glutaredoxin